MATQVLIPTVLIVTLALGTLTQLETIAKQSSEKAVKYSGYMNDAIPCAFEARPLDECSPKLFSTSFKEETKQTQAILAEIKAQQPGSKLKTEADLPKKDEKKRA